MTIEKENRNSDLQAHSIEIERYKYILQQKTVLNDRAFQILSLYQTLMTAAVGGLLTIFFGWRSLQVDPEGVIAGIYALLLFFLLVAIFAFVSLLSGVYAWIRYKREEENLIGTILVEKQNGVTHLFGWYETYMILFILLSAAIIVWVSLVFLVPGIK